MSTDLPALGSIKRPGEHIIISGTGRAGTTFLVEYLTLLGFDTGFVPADFESVSKSDARAGLEHRIGAQDLPYVIKSPTHSDDMANIVEWGTPRISMAILPVRDLHAAAESGRRVTWDIEASGRSADGAAGALWKTDDPAMQEHQLALQFHKLVEGLVAAGIPTIFLHYPEYIRSHDVLYSALKPILSAHGLSEDQSVVAYAATYRPELVHEYPAARVEDPVPMPRATTGVVRRRVSANRLERVRRTVGSFARRATSGVLPSPLFDATWYRRTYPGVPSGRVRAYLHYRRRGWADGRDPNPWLNTAWYRATYTDVAAKRMDPAEHYLRFGAIEGRDPGPDFSTGLYLRDNRDVAASGINPLAHYLHYGRLEGRSIRPANAVGALPEAAVFSGPYAEVAGRPFASLVPGPVLDAIQYGTQRMMYRDVRCTKSPFDLALYVMLIQKLRPRTIIELGTFDGGSALWFADMLTCHGIDTPRVISIDIDQRAAFEDPRITFMRGDARRLGGVLDAPMLAGLARPLLVVEDASHMYEDSLAVLRFFDDHLRPDEYIVIEDGNLSLLSLIGNDRFGDGPNRAVAEFLGERGDAYEIDSSLCDFFGYNATWNLNGWLRRVR